MPNRLSAVASILSAILLATLMSAAARADDYAPHDSVKVGNKLCFAEHYHSGGGAGKTKNAARLSAIRSWADFVDFEYGSAWARWSLSVSQNVKYTKEADGWSATVDSRPCKRRR